MLLKRFFLTCVAMRFLSIELDQISQEWNTANKQPERRMETPLIHQQRQGKVIISFTHLLKTQSFIYAASHIFLHMQLTMLLHNYMN